MRYPADHKQRTRERILDAAATVFRRQGFAGGSVDEVMAEAGLTPGGFYSHFASKDLLFLESVVRALRESRIIRVSDNAGQAGPEPLRRIATRYLSPLHRKSLADGCVLPALLPELGRQPPAARQSFEETLLEIVHGLAPHLNDAAPETAEPQILAILSVLIGGMMLARAVSSETLADQILAACRALIETQLPPPSIP